MSPTKPPTDIAIIEVVDGHIAHIDDELLRDAEDFARKSKSPRTLALYEWAFHRFVTFCENKKLQSLPAAPKTVAVYLANEAKAGLKPATIAILRAAIASAHRLDGHAPLPTDAEMVRAVLAGIRREKGVAPERKAALTIDLLRRICHGLGSSLVETRDRALLTLGFALAARRSELVGLDVRHIATHERGLVVTIARSKTDQEGRGYRVPVGFGSSEQTCPVRAIDAYVTNADIVDGPLFRSIHGRAIGETRLQGRAVARIVQKRVGEILGKEAAKSFSGHSIRSGTITSAAQAGVPSHQIREISRHASTAILESVYVRPARIWDRDLVKRMGL